EEYMTRYRRRALPRCACIDWYWRGYMWFCFFFSSRRRHTRFSRDWSSDVCSSDLDPDAVETSEWLEALDAVVAHDGVDRARQIVTRVIERAQHAGTGPIGSLNTPYVNTIPVEREPAFPGDPLLERRLRSIVRWNAIAIAV